MFSIQNGIKLEISGRKIPGKVTNIWKLSNTLLDPLYITKAIQDVENISNQMNTQNIKSYGCS